jgi:hypothetical protein
LKVLCGACGAEFEAKRSTAKFCGATCQKRARRRGRSRTTNPGEAGTVGGKRTKRPLVEAVRNDLVKAGRLETTDGQIAMLLAEQAAVATGSAASSLTKALRDAVDRAVEGVAVPTGGAAKKARSEKSELDKARERREQKARQAARRA